MKNLGKGKEKKNESYCNLCEKQLSNKWNFNKHYDAIHLKVKLYHCKICGKSYSDPTPLRIHMEIHKVDTNQKSFKCSECDKAFVLKNYLDHHKTRTHTDKWKKACELCSIKCFSASQLNKHISTVHGDREKKYKCPEIECGSSFLHQDYLKFHMKKHENDKTNKKFYCDQCDKVYPRSESLQKHKRYIHKNSEKGKWHCKICDKYYAQRGGLYEHSKIHGNREYKCEICGSEFFQKIILKRHMYTHQPNKPHECDQCTMSFHCNSDLETHRIIHLGEMPFDCDKCGKKFAAKSSKRMHLNKGCPAIKI